MTLAITLATQTLPAAAGSLGRSTLRILEARQQTRRLDITLEARHRYTAELCARAMLLSGDLTDHPGALLGALAQERDPALRAPLLDALESLSEQEERQLRQLFGR